MTIADKLREVRNYIEKQSDCLCHLCKGTCARCNALAALPDPEEWESLHRGEGAHGPLCADEVYRLTKQRDDLAAEVEDWKDSARQAASEECNKLDKVHCSCVGPLRKVNEELRAALRDVIDQYNVVCSCELVEDFNEHSKHCAKGKAQAALKRVEES